MTKKKSGRPTKMAGVESLGNRRFRVRARVKDQRTGRMLERDRTIEEATVHDAIRLKATLIEEMEQEGGGQRSDEGKRTLGDFATSWLHGIWNNLAPLTRQRYLASLDDHILPALGERTLASLNCEDIESWRDQMKRDKYAASTVNGHVRVLRTVLGRAVRVGALRWNPATEVRALPEDDARVTDEEPNALDGNEVSRFLEAARKFESEHYAMILTLMTTGMRMSAARALRVEDIDEEKGIIIVRRRASGDEVIPGVKRSRKSKDIVPLLPELAAVLKAHRASFNEAQAASGLIFPTRKGTLRARSVLKRPFANIMKHAKLTKRFTPHGCRRTANDFYRRVSSEVVTRAITGHLTAAMHEHYSTVTAEEKQAAARRAFASLFQSGGSSGGTGSVGEDTIH